MTPIGKFLADRRRRKGLTQMQVAIAAGMTQSEISRLECDARRVNVTFESVRRIAIALDISLDELRHIQQTAGDTA